MLIFLSRQCEPVVRNECSTEYVEQCTWDTETKCRKEERQQCETMHVEFCETEAIQTCVENLETMCKKEFVEECWEENEKDCKSVQYFNSKIALSLVVCLKIK